MIISETDQPPDNFEFDLIFVAVGFEQRCTYAVQALDARAPVSIGLTFGFLQDLGYEQNKEYFERSGFELMAGLEASTVSNIISIVDNKFHQKDHVLHVMVDISSMSREMMANVILALEAACPGRRSVVSVVYAPSKFVRAAQQAPITVARPLKQELAGWSSRPELPLGTLVGLGCEPGLALGALQYLEPDRVGAYRPVGIDQRFDEALVGANEYLDDIFDVVNFGYQIDGPTVLRGKFEAVLNSMAEDFRMLVLPFGPKIFAWAAISTVVFGEKSAVGVWTFSARNQATLADRVADGPLVWYRAVVQHSAVS